MCLAGGALLLGSTRFCAAQDSTHYLPDAVDVTVDAAHDTDAEVTRLAAVGNADIRVPDIHMMRLRLGSGVSVAQALAHLEQYPEVIHAQPDWYVYGCSTPPTPNDTYYSGGSDVQFAPQQVLADYAWSMWNPISAVVVADLGTGIDYTHPDLTNKMYRSATYPYPVIGHNVGVYDAYSGDYTGFVDDQGHNTLVAGVLAAQVDNGTGIAGIAGWNGVALSTDTAHTLLMPVKVLDDTAPAGAGSDATVAAGIDWAANNGANVINMSLGGPGTEQDWVLTIPAPNTGTFTLTFNGYATGAIAWDASAATIRSDLEALPGGNLFFVSTPGAGEWNIAFFGSGGTLTGNGSGLGTPTGFGVGASSDGGSTESSAVSYAWGKGCLLVAAAGNDHVSAKRYPAAFTDCISVAAVDRSDVLTYYSEYGSWVNVAAPGGDGSSNKANNILSTWPQYTGAPAPPTAYGASPTAGYAYDAGTSFACPVVSGEAALMWAQNPNLTNQDIYNVITKEWDPVTAYSGHSGIGGGRVNIYHALQEAASGYGSRAELVEDGSGNFYGTTVSGGAYGGGTVFKMDSSGNVTVLHSFGASGDGANPYGGLIFSTSGTYLWGTTKNGGTSGYGTVFAVKPDGSAYYDEHNFDDTHGANPACTLAVIHNSGNNTDAYYGVTLYGGAHGNGCVFSLVTPTPTYSDFYDFPSTGGGANPYGGLAVASSTVLWGTTLNGGSSSDGVVFSITTSGTLTPELQFNGTNGANPYSQLVEDASGNFYGTTYNGGANSEGVLYSVSSPTSSTTLHSFGAAGDGEKPVGRLSFNSAATELWGATQFGGANAYGVAYKWVISSGTESVLGSFDGASNGGYGYSGLVYNSSDSYFYGTLQEGGTFGGGAIYRVSASATHYPFEFGY